MEILGVNGEKLCSRNLGDLLGLREEASGSGGSSSSSSGLTLYAVLAEKRRLHQAASERTRTLLDVINEERISAARIDGGNSWRSLTERIRLRRRYGGSDWPPGDASTPIQSIASLTSEPITDVEPQREEPARMSLMALLAENDRQMGSDGSTYVMISEEESELEVIGGVEFGNCCVCMVRQKGAAFIPCGHTFCRRCSREVWVQRGNCPLCNNAIVEILDIF